MLPPTDPSIGNTVRRRRLLITGVVQGVGFRPYVHSLATELALAGFIGNDSNGVFVEIEGGVAKLDEFHRRLLAEAPPAARIQTVASRDVPPNGSSSFSIVASVSRTAGQALVSPDLRTCDDCLRELDDPQDRRYGYPFINCTNCGPRFTITRRTPYDRPNTTMATFSMCAECRREYEDPADRRFHAQPNACPLCGPAVWLEPNIGSRVSADPITATRDLIADGKTVAVKGIGGFHLACDATSDDALARLRERKGRVDKPFAIMVADTTTAAALVDIDAAESRLLESRERPIVLARALPDTPVSPLVAPGNGYLGVMLPYTPLHYLLIRRGDIWVMTSGNRSSEPIVKDNDAARNHLGNLADAFLMHDRPIEVPCDDSVVRILGREELPVRRSRGYAPFPVALPFDVPPLLATGGELKATFCLATNRDGFMSQHIGDMENLETLAAFTAAVDQMQNLFRIEPELVATDLHPGYLSGRWAEETSNGRPVVRVQHHHAHIAAVMAENQLDETVIGFSFDGTGFGTDGTVWGGEVLLADYDSFTRAAHLATVPLPGGDAAVLRPYRMALSHLWAADVPWSEDLPPVSTTDPTERGALSIQLERQLNTVDTSSMGRLFDAVSSLAGVRHEVTYEAQAAIELEALVDDATSGAYQFAIHTGASPFQIDPSPVVAAAADDIRSGAPAEVVAARFHRAVVAMMVEVAERLQQRHRIATVGLSGGVFQNMTIASAARRRLEAAGFAVAMHHQVPPNDGGLALGQAMVAARIQSR